MSVSLGSDIVELWSDNFVTNFYKWHVHDK